VTLQMSLRGGNYLRSASALKRRATIKGPYGTRNRRSTLVALLHERDARAYIASRRL
jgi:hypothetical protein